MAEHNFDQFSYEGSKINLSEALIDDSDLDPKYEKDKLYCPECHIAQLRFTRKSSVRKAFLSTKPGSKDDNNSHSSSCSYQYEQASKKQIKQYYTELSDNQIKDKLDSAINHFLKPTSQNIQNHNSEITQNNPAVIETYTESGVTHRRLITRSIYNIYLTPEDELNIPILFYGVVKLQTDSKESKFNNGLYNRLWLCHKNTGKRIRFLIRGRSKDEISPDQLYYVAFVGVVSHSDNYKYIIKLYKPNSIRYVCISDQPYQTLPSDSNS